jgi:1,2-dihydroxy-3-keto-5-methylthiopentene dioxygenase
MRIYTNTTWLNDPTSWDAILTPLGLEAGHWPMPEETDIAQSNPLLAVAESLAELKHRRQYATEDVVQLTPDNPKLDEILKPFESPHFHTDDEVRVCLAGEGIFRIYPTPDYRDLGAKDVIDIWVQPGDLLVVPAMTMHSFHLTDKRHITAIRIFKANPRWEAHYHWPKAAKTAH